MGACVRGGEAGIRSPFLGLRARGRSRGMCCSSSALMYSGQSGLGSTVVLVLWRRVCIFPSRFPDAGIALGGGSSEWARSGSSIALRVGTGRGWLC